MRRSLGMAALVLIVGSSQGCGMAHPRNFRKIRHPAPMVRARALSLGDRKPSVQVVPELVGRLDDADPVVRLAAHEELKRRTGQDFGYVPWAEDDERREAVDRWRDWLGGKAPRATPSPQTLASPQAPAPEAATPAAQLRPVSRIRRTIPH